MVSPLTILKDVLNLKHSRMHVSGWEEREETVKSETEPIKDSRRHGYSISCPDHIPLLR